MALPNTIANGQDPDGDKLQANFNYLYGMVSAGIIITKASYSSLRVTAADAPTAAFIAIAAAPDNLLLLYTGDVTAGDGGFITLSSWVPGGIS